MKSSTTTPTTIDLQLFQTTPGKTVLLLPDAPRFTIVAVTDDHMQLTGRSRAELVGKGLLEAFPNAPDDPEKKGEKAVRTSFTHVLTMKEAHRMPLQRYDITDASGLFEERYWSTLTKPVMNVAGEVIYLIHSIEDVTSQIKAKQREEQLASVQTQHEELQTAYAKLQESEGKYHTLFTSIDQGSCIIEIIFDLEKKPVNYRFVEINPVFEQQTGLKNAVGKTARELIPDLEPHWFERYGKVATTGKAIRFVEVSEVMGKWFDVFAYRMGGDGSRNVMLLFTDITKRRKQEEALKQSERNLRSMIMQAPLAMCIFRGEDFVIEAANESMFTFWGKSAEDVMQKPLFTAIPEAKSQGYEELMATVLQTGEPFAAKELSVTLPRNGTVQEVFIDFSYTPIREPDGSISGILAVAMDVTEQVLARKKIEENREALKRFKFMADNAQDPFILMREDGTFAYLNQKALDAWGYTEQEAKHIRVPDVDPIYQDEQFSEIFARAQREVIPQFETLHRRKDGYIYPVEVNMGGLTLGGEPHLFAIARDITERKRLEDAIRHNEADLQRRVEERTAELAAANQELKRSNQNLEEFAYAASHDLKEPIRKIHFYADRLKHELGEKLSRDQNHLFSRLEHASQRMNNLIDDLLLYSHVSLGATHREKVDLTEMVQHVLEDLELEIEQKSAQITLDPLPAVSGHKRQLQQLFQNLISNALKYSKPDAQPQINVTSRKVVGKEVRPDFPAGEASLFFHLIEVRDNGIGFSQEDAERIFNVFTRLHGNAEYKGTGVGLSIVRKVVQNHGGYTWAESIPGEGSTFKVLMPAE